MVKGSRNGRAEESKDAETNQPRDAVFEVRATSQHFQSSLKKGASIPCRVAPAAKICAVERNAIVICATSDHNSLDEQLNVPRAP